MFRGNFFFRAIAALILVGLLAAGGYFIFQAGQAQGYAMGVAASAASAAPGGSSSGVAPSVPVQPGVAPYMYPGYYYPGFYRPHFFFPFWGPFGLLIPLLFFFLIIGLFRAIFWRRGHGYGPGYYGHGHWHGDWQGQPGPHPGEGSQPPAGKTPESGAASKE